MPQWADREGLAPCSDQRTREPEKRRGSDDADGARRDETGGRERRDLEEPEPLGCERRVSCLVPVEHSRVEALLASKDDMA